MEKSNIIISSGSPSLRNFQIQKLNGDGLFFRQNNSLLNILTVRNYSSAKISQDNKKGSLFDKSRLIKDSKFLSRYNQGCRFKISGAQYDGDDDLDGVNRDKPAQYNGKDLIDERLSHAVWSENIVNNVTITHVRPPKFVDKAAYWTVWTLRRAFDYGTGYAFGLNNEACMVRRVMILETVAGIPGMVGAMIRHLQSLRKMEHDYGWIHTLLEEAENERMHLMTALLLRRPSWIIRFVVLAAQTGFTPFYTLMYLLSPRYCHRFVGYLEEEAVKTYTDLIKHMDDGKLPGFDIPAPKAARVYWQLPEDANLRDVWMAIRADEAHHREVNHTFASMKKSDINPFPPGY